METNRKRAKVIMLPTDKASNIWVTPNCIQFNKEPVDAVTNHHLYFIPTDEEIKKNPNLFKIKEGDWCIYQGKAKQALGEVIVKFANNYDAKKIIATTDPELIEINCTTCANMGCDKCQDKYLLHQPSKAFIEKFCKVGGIDEVDVEYIRVSCRKCRMKGVGNPTIHCTECGKSGISIIPKVDSHNTITIHPIKDSWSKDEIIELFREYQIDKARQILDNGEPIIPLEWLDERLSKI
jgi:hypothetical protein